MYTREHNTVNPYPVGCHLGHIGPRTAWKQWRAAIFMLFFPSLFIVRATLFIRQRSAASFAEVDKHAAVQVAIVAAIWLIILFMYRLRLLLNRLSRTSVALLMLFYAFCGVSALWSPLRLYSLYRAAEVIGVWLIVFAAINCSRTFERAERLVLGFAGFILVMGILGSLISSRGVSLISNHYPVTAVLILCYCFGEAGKATGRRRRLLLFCTLASGVSVAMGGSASGNVAAVCGLLAISIVRHGRGRAITILILVPVCLLLLMGWIDWIGEVALRVFFPTKTWAMVQSGHGRVDIWKQCWPLIVEKPFLGYGFAVATRSKLEAVSAHNTIVAILVDTGISGLALFSLSVGAFLCEVHRRMRVNTPGLVGCFCAFTAVFVICTGTAFLGTNLYPGTVSFGAFAGLFALFVLPQHHQVTSGCRSSISWRGGFLS